MKSGTVLEMLYSRENQVCLHYYVQVVWKRKILRQFCGIIMGFSNIAPKCFFQHVSPTMSLEKDWTLDRSLWCFQQLTAAAGRVDQRGPSRPGGPVRRLLDCRWGTCRDSETSERVRAGPGAQTQAPWFTLLQRRSFPPCFLGLSFWGQEGGV